LVEFSDQQNFADGCSQFAFRPRSAMPILTLERPAGRAGWTLVHFQDEDRGNRWIACHDLFYYSGSAAGYGAA